LTSHYCEKEQPVHTTASFGTELQQSSIDYLNPDAGATYTDERAGNEGDGFTILEIRENICKVGRSLYFDKNGNAMDYRMS
jgi:hypothetical protein